ncbi:MAG: TonB-dependent receptor [Bacteroidetes bacterium]|nr:TonB-dependent receptor [Bacteroidota bacterium]
MRIVLMHLFLCLSTLCSAQAFQGYIIEETPNKRSFAISNAVVAVLNSTEYAVTDSNGYFTLSRVNPEFDSLVIAAFGYKKDTVSLNGNTMATISMQPLELQEAVISVNRREVSVGDVEVISSADLVKDACCNLSEVFENTATVDISYSDAVSGAKEIHMLGLDGAYAQVLVENMPGMRGLGNTFGMNYIPGPWMSSIQVNKGCGSVVNGYESMMGQINVEFKKPQFADKLFVNFFLNQDARSELNIIHTHKIKKRWSYLGAYHGFYNWLRMDMNHDHFIDNPLVMNGNSLQRFTYENPGKMMFVGAVSVNIEDRVGGSVHYKPYTDKHAAHTAWGIRLRTDKIDAIAKTGFTFADGQSLGIQYKYTYHHQRGDIGLKRYDATEHFGYLNFIFQHEIDDTEDLLKAGVSLQLNSVREQLNDILLQRVEIVPGMFGEANLNFGVEKQVMLTAGVRADYHNLYGALASPRVNLKWRIIYGLNLRLSAGRGYRVPTLFAENFGWLANNRTVMVSSNLGIEESWNCGAGLVYDFDLNFRPGSITVDYFRTDFIRQVVPDIEQPGYLQFYAISKASSANALQVDVNYEPVKRLDVKLSYKYELSTVQYKSGKKLIPFRPQHRGLISIAYATKDKHWRFNSSLNWFGKTRVPDYRLTPDLAYQSSGKNWFQWNAQITYIIRQWEIYAGAENMLNFTQKTPIVMNDAPFSNQFDASMIWGPVRGAMAFAGFRWNMK